MRRGPVAILPIILSLQFVILHALSMQQPKKSHWTKASKRVKAKSLDTYLNASLAGTERAAGR